MSKKIVRWSVIVLIILVVLLFVAPVVFRIILAILFLPAVLAGLYVFFRWYPDYEKRQLEKSE